MSTVDEEWLRLLEANQRMMAEALDIKGPSQEVSLAKTKLDECMLWAREAVREKAPALVPAKYEDQANRVAFCLQCGLRLDHLNQAMGYVCYRTDCPRVPAPACSTSTS